MSTNPSPVRIPSIFSRYSNVIAGESTRHGGVSPAPFNALNLGGNTQDDPAHVAENNRIFFSAVGIGLDQVAKSHQVHGDQILTVDVAGRFEGYDALITNVAGVQLAVTIADCTPILIYDAVRQAVAAIHAGWRGTASQIVAKTIAQMTTAYGTNAADCVAYVGTCIDECSFEVGTEVAGHFESAHKRWDDTLGKFFVDLKAANRDQLIAAGVLPQNIQVSSYSTVLHNEDYFSYRLEKGNTGRMLATIGLQKQN